MFFTLAEGEHYVDRGHLGGLSRPIERPLASPSSSPATTR
jgi:hypothetical protein